MGSKCVVELIRNTSVGTKGIDGLEKKKKESTSYFYNGFSFYPILVTKFTEFNRILHSQKNCFVSSL